MLHTRYSSSTCVGVVLDGNGVVGVAGVVLAVGTVTIQNRGRPSENRVKSPPVPPALTLPSIF
jgi:hypothetical protein